MRTLISGLSLGYYTIISAEEEDASLWVVQNDGEKDEPVLGKNEISFV